MSTPSQEDYVEAIWLLTQEKGYARVTDIAERLHISQASVSKMLRRLNAEGLLELERYRGMALTAQGIRQGQRLLARHQTLERFLQHLGVSDPQMVYRDVEGIEHHFSAYTLEQLTALVHYIDENPTWWQHFIQNLPEAK